MKFYGNKNSVFANALVSEYVTSNDFNIEVSTGEWLSKEIEKAMPDKDDFFEEIKKASKKTRNGRSFTKLERTQMKKDAAMKRAKALGVEGSPEEGTDFYPTLAKARRKARNAKEKGRQYYNTVVKTNHYATNKAYEAISRKEREAKANKYGLKIEKDSNEPWEQEVYSYEEVYLIPYRLLEAEQELAIAKKALEEKKEELKKLQFFLNSFEGEAAGNMTVAECYHLYDHTASEEQRLLYAIDIYEDDVRYAEAEYAEAKEAYDMLPFWVR